ncbi:MAG TPA: Hsp20/alpha crystallin family protein [Anaerolineales bacterium]|nr:Hsp20/alpha crystallin family protein [Anaerolineales bacterium]
MPTIIRRSSSTLLETRREILQAIHWQIHSSVWSPPTDIYETDSGYVIKVEIAGMSEDDFEVIVEDNILRISGNRPDSSERRAYHQMEIQFGKFEIAVELPAPVDVENASAVYKDGFLTIQLPRVGTKKEIEVET